MSKKMFDRLRISVSLMLVLLLLTPVGCSFGDGTSGDDTATGSDAVGAAESGYDIVLGLDRSSSIHYYERQQRNIAAQTLVRCMTADCRLGSFFFAKNTNIESKKQKTDSCGMLSMSEESNRQTFLSLFDPETGRMDRAGNEYDGTNLATAMKTALAMFDAESEKSKAIILFTDGVNYVSNGSGENDLKKAAKVDTETKKQVEKALTADNGQAIPIYVVYLGQDESTAESEINKLRELFSNSAQTARVINASAENAEWSGFEWIENSNKIICLNEADDLSSVFPKIFYKIKNVASFTYDNSPNDSGIVSVGFTVPNFGSSRIQITASSGKAFTVKRMYSIDGNESIEIDTGVNEGDIYADAETKTEDTFSPGSWQIDFEGSGNIAGTIAVFSDFSPAVSFLQNGSVSETVACCTDTSMEVTLQDTAGKAISLPKSASARLKIEDSTDGDEPIAVNVGRSKMESEQFAVRNPGLHRYIMVIDYEDHLSYPIEGEIDVTDAPPCILAEKANIVYSSDELLGGQYLDIGRVTDYVADAHDGETLDVVINDDKAPCFVMTYPAFSAKVVSCSDAAHYDDTARHIFMETGSEKRHRLQISAVDSSGTPVLGETEITLTSNTSRILLFIVFGVLIAAAAGFAVWKVLQSHTKKETAVRSDRPRAYSVCIKTSGASGDYCRVIPSRTSLFGQSKADCPLDGITLTSAYSEESQELKNFPLVLVLAENALQLRIDKEAARTIKKSGSGFGGYQFQIKPTDSDGSAESGSEFWLNPDEKYTVTYNHIEIELLFCEGNDFMTLWSDNEFLQ